MTIPHQPTGMPPRARIARRPTAARAAGVLAVAMALPLALVAAQPAGAQSNRIMCSQPVKPTCVDSELTYEDPQRIDRCERDVENYVSSVEEYLSCLSDKAEAQKKAMEDLRETFRCNADPDKSC
jgi:hypothetical protein